MLKPQGTKRESFGRFCAGAIAVFLLVFMAYLLPCSLFRTTAVSTGVGKGEIIIFNYDNFFLNAIALFVTLGIIYLLYKYGSGISLKTCLLGMSLWVLIFGAVFVACAKLRPSEDSYVLSFFARQAAAGDYSYYHDYFKLFPFQLGFVLYEELFFRIFFAVLPGAPTGFSSMALQGMNVLFILAAYHCIIAAVSLLTESETVCKLTALLLSLCLPPLFMCTFMYGNVPALAFGCAACWRFIAFDKSGRWADGVLCVLAITLAVILKLNSLIFFVALGIIWLLRILVKPDFRSALLLVLMVVSVLVAKDLPQRWYEERCEVEFGSGVPQLGWLAMGLHEGQTCSGWYDTDYTTSAYLDTGMDTEATSAIAKEAIGERIKWFVSKPMEGLRFFGRKFLSQWNEPSYQSLWNNQVRDHYSKPIFLFDLLCYRLERLILIFMKLYQQMLFFAFTLGLVRVLCLRELRHSIFPLVILGGMLYHLLFEAKSQYVMGYFVLMVPVAAIGLSWFFDRLKNCEPKQTPPRR